MPAWYYTTLLEYGHQARLIALSSAILLVSACATQAFIPRPVDTTGFLQRGITQEQESLIVTASVPDAEETMQIFGADLYSKDIQPVWLKVENRRDSIVRIIHTSIDADYFSPLEVSWVNRKQFKKSSRESYDAWFVENALPRYLAPGETRSGFIFTHASRGTKGFNLEFYGDMRATSFTFFVPLPGFRPDYMNVGFTRLYDDEEILTGSFTDLKKKLQDQDCCTLDDSGKESGGPLNAAIVGTPEAVRRALLRGGWQESEDGSQESALARLHHYQGRPPDGTFHKTRTNGSEQKELRLWLSPMLIDGETVWLGQVKSIMNDRKSSKSLDSLHVDPDLDDARMYLLQNFWYSQSLRSFTTITGTHTATIDAPHKDFRGSQYFTDGLRVVLFVSEDPISMRETQIQEWSSAIDQ